MHWEISCSRCDAVSRAWTRRGLLDRCWPARALGTGLAARGSMPSGESHSGSTCITISRRRHGWRRCKKAKLDNPPMANWSPEKSLEDMDQGGVATAMTSPTTPQLGFLPAADAARIAREVERVRPQDRQRPPRPLRRVRDAADALRRRKPEGNRLRLRHAARRRHRHDDRATATNGWATPSSSRCSTN